MDDSPTRTTPLLEEYFPGSLIGEKYALEAVIGQGGMGSVWRANNVVLDMPVAIKLIRPEVRGAGTTDLLLNEARLAAKLQHPSVVRLFDFGVAKTGDAYIVMELLRGPSLADVLERHGKLSAVAAVRLLLPIVRGLCAAHRRGIVHLDLKPENIVISEAGEKRQPKLLDFGIAKKLGLRDNAAAASGTLIGSPAYMSPEQACGSQDIDARADIWGICVVLYELVCGRAPFTGETPSDTLAAVIESEPAPLDGDDVGTHALWSIVQVGLSKDRQLRFANATELADALAQWLAERELHHELWQNRQIVSDAADARTGAALHWFYSGVAKLAANDGAAIVRAPAPRRWRASWLGVAACLSVAAVAAVALWRVDAAGRSSARPAIASEARLAQHELSEPPAAALVLQLAAADASAEPDREELEASTASAVGSVSKHSTAQLRSAARATKLSAKRAARARSREAVLGLKDPFQ